MSLKQNIVVQFKQPHGLVGQFAGFIMANRPSNIERNKWTLDPLIYWRLNQLTTFLKWALDLASPLKRHPKSSQKV